MKKNPQQKALIGKIDSAWHKTHRELQSSQKGKKKNFLCGYKLALNELSGWIERKPK